MAEKNNSNFQIKFAEGTPTYNEAKKAFLDFTRWLIEADFIQTQKSTEYKDDKEREEKVRDSIRGHGIIMRALDNGFDQLFPNVRNETRGNSDKKTDDLKQD